MFSTIFRALEQFHLRAIELRIGGSGIGTVKRRLERRKVSQTELVERIGIEMKIISVISEPLGTYVKDAAIALRIFGESAIHGRIIRQKRRFDSILKEIAERSDKKRRILESKP